MIAGAGVGIDARQFFHLLYGEEAPGYLPIFTLPGEETHWCPAADLPAAAARTEALAATHDVYYGLGLHPQPLGPTHRGTAEGVIAFPGLHIDADYGTHGHKKPGLPPTREDALALIGDFPLPPTMIIFSGHGLQAYWLLRELWLLDTDEERALAQDLAYRFNMTMAEKARARGWTLDSTHSLAQVLRPPGTVNRKLEPVAVEALAADESARYSQEEIEPYLLDVAWARANRASVEAVEFPRDLRRVALEGLPVPAWTRALLRDGRDPDYPDSYPSRSEAQWQALRELVRAGCDDATIGGVFFDAANAIGEKAREKGRRWLAGDLARARATVVGEPRLSWSTSGGADPRGDESDELERLRADNVALNRHLAQIALVLRNPELSATQKIVGLVAVFELMSATSRNGDEPQPLYRERIAERAGVSADTAGKALDVISEPGGIFKKFTTYERIEVVDRETGEITPRPHKVCKFTPQYADVGESLRALAGYTPPERPAWGGKREPRCPDHPDAGTVERRVLCCKACGRAVVGDLPAPEPLYTQDAATNTNPVR